MAAKPLPDADLLRQLLRYDPDTGRLFWRPRQRAQQPNCPQRLIDYFNQTYAGKPAFSQKDKEGYFKGKLFGVQFSAHRLIWKMMTGADPDLVDHINGNPSDNRWGNLRSVSPTINNLNRKKSANSVSGLTGVYWRDDLKKWEAKIQIRRKKRHLGSFASKEAALAARLKAEKEMGFHPHHGKRI